MNLHKKITIACITSLLAAATFADSSRALYRYTNSCAKTTDCTVITIHNNTGHMITNFIPPYEIVGQWKSGAFNKGIIPAGDTTDVLYSQVEGPGQFGYATFFLRVLSDQACMGFSMLAGLNGSLIYANADGTCNVAYKAKSDGLYVDMIITEKTGKKVQLSNPAAG